MAPGPFLPTVLVSALLESAGDAPAAKELLPGLAVGETVAAVALRESAGALTGEETSGGLRVTGTLRPVIGAHLASVVLAPVDLAGRAPGAEGGGNAGGEVWCVLDAASFSARELPSVDATRRVAEVTVDGARRRARAGLTGLDARRSPVTSPACSRQPSSSASRSGA